MATLLGLFGLMIFITEHKATAFYVWLISLYGPIFLGMCIFRQLLSVIHGTSLVPKKAIMETCRYSNGQFEVKMVVGDGSCLFKSLTLLLEDDETKHNRTRERTVGCVSNNSNEFHKFVRGRITLRGVKHSIHSKVKYKVCIGNYKMFGRYRL
jgi:hypothetical protein